MAKPRQSKCGYCSQRMAVSFRGKSAGIRCPRCGRASMVVKGKTWTQRTPLDSARAKISSGRQAILTKAEKSAVSARIGANARAMAGPTPAQYAMVTKSDRASVARAAERAQTAVLRGLDDTARNATDPTMREAAWQKAAMMRGFISA